VILEVAILNVKPGQEKEFEATFAKAQAIIFKQAGLCLASIAKVHRTLEPVHTPSKLAKSRRS
jgi:heme-degrading monooxygenase HmoA